MKRILPGIITLVLGYSPWVLSQEDHSAHMMESKSKAAVAVQQDEKLPTGEEGAKAALEKSPRHGEWVDIKYEGSEFPLRTWIVYPEKKEKAPVVIVIHEIYGASDWIRALADQLAEDGYIAVAPDLISGMGPNGGGTESAASRDDVVRLIRGLSAEETYQRLNTVRSYAMQLPSANGKTATVGYCWGGSMSFGYACVQPGLNAAIVYYGSSPAADALAKLNTPVLGLYGGDDARVNATIEPASTEVKKLGKTYEHEIYEGAGHGFLRAQSGREGANLKATQQAWPRMLSFLKKHL
ncbi:MAG: dienelactone hydrolase family protein [Ignavibacteriales bacterium]|nr:dienelactone hydrolase family protein [Ignavibacteriales bacterium]